MDFLELAEKRYSVRKFADRPLEQAHLRQILRAGHLAPTACNRQPQRILVVDSEDGPKRLRMCTGSHFGAPAAMIVCCSKKECWVREYDEKPSGEIDAGIVTTFMMLEAASLGVGTTWVMHFIPEAVRCEFHLPEDVEPVAVLVMGYPAPDSEPSPMHTARRPEEDLVRYNSF